MYEDPRQITISDIVRAVRAAVISALSAGGEGSGFEDHAGRPGERGGSMPREGGATYDSDAKAWRDRTGRELPPHIAALKIPPGWSDVRYNKDPDADLMVTGRDAKGRSVYIYSDKFVAEKAAEKWSRVAELDEKYGVILSEVERDITAGESVEEASALRLVMMTAVRPGSDKDTGGAKKAYGATTLEGRHVVISGSEVRLQFVGKKGVNISISVADRKVADDLMARKERSGDMGRLFSTDSQKLLEYTRARDGGEFKTKDFRTLVATRTAISEVGRMPRPNGDKEYKSSVSSVAKVVASRLGNTPTVALQSYINPVVFARWRMR